MYCEACLTFLLYEHGLTNVNRNIECRKRASEISSACAWSRARRGATGGGEHRICREGIRRRNDDGDRARAGSSIGSLYQFFPTKDQIAGALVESYLNMLAETFRKLSEAAPTLDLSLLASRLTRTFLRFRETHPAFAALVETYSYALPGTVSIRERLRGEIESVLAAVAPHLAPAEITVRAAVIQQIMKGAVAINGDTSIAGRKAAIDELEGLMQHYLHEVIKLSR